MKKAEKTILLVQESPDEIVGLTGFQRQQIEILYGMPVKNVASSQVVFMRGKIELQGNGAMKDVCLELDENVIDWFEYRLEEGQSWKRLSEALIGHINDIVPTRPTDGRKTRRQCG